MPNFVVIATKIVDHVLVHWFGGNIDLFEDKYRTRGFLTNKIFFALEKGQVEYSPNMATILEALQEQDILQGELG